MDVHFTAEMLMYQGWNKKIDFATFSVEIAKR